jgi:hypothetical protein
VSDPAAGAAGLRLWRVVPTRSPAGLQVIEATVAGDS